MTLFPRCDLHSEFSADIKLGIARVVKYFLLNSKADVMVG